MIASTEADGGLPVSFQYFYFLFLSFFFLVVNSLKFIHCVFQSLPRLRFNKEGNLLAVTTVDNGFKILANAEGLRTLRAFGNRSLEAFRAQYEAAALKVLINLCCSPSSFLHHPSRGTTILIMLNIKFQRPLSLVRYLVLLLQQVSLRTSVEWTAQIEILLLGHLL